MLISATTFLFLIQLKGILGIENKEVRMERFKYDAIDYYERDFHWFSYSFLMITLNIWLTWLKGSKYLLYNLTHSNHETLSLLLIVARMVVLVTSFQIRDAKRNILMISNKVWIGYILMYSSLWAFWFSNAYIF